MNINKQKLIEELEESSMINVYDSYKGEFADYIKLDTARDLIKSQPPADQWIPCSDPPKEDGMYFITAKVLDKLEVQYVFYQKNLNLFICNGTPTAWMPLPEPYKGEQHEHD